MLNDIRQRVDALDTTLFDDVLAQSTYWDRRALLGLHAAAAQEIGSFGYLEIGSYLGGSLQALVRDPRCARIISIDSRPPAPPDNRTGTWEYEDNSTARMLELLGAIPGASLDKLTTFEDGTNVLEPGELPFRPDYCFIDAEHTDEAVLRDARFCAQALGGRGVVAFHDADIVGDGIQAFVREAWSDVSLVVPFTGVVLAVELGGAKMLQSPSVRVAIGSWWHPIVWRAASHSTPAAVFAAWRAVRRADRAIARARGVSATR